MATRRIVGIRSCVAALAIAALATATWAVAQDGGNGADTAGPAGQQSQDQSPDQSQNQAATAGNQQRPFARDGRGRFERGDAGRFARARRRRGALVAAMRLDAPMLSAFRRLNLSNSQRQNVHTILLNARNSARQERGNQARAADNRQNEAALRNPGDPNYARAVEAVKSRAVDRIQRATQTQQALYDVLTPAQKTQLTQIFAQRRARLQQRDAQPPGLHG